MLSFLVTDLKLTLLTNDWLKKITLHTPGSYRYLNTNYKTLHIYLSENFLLATCFCSLTLRSLIEIFLGFANTSYGLLHQWIINSSVIKINSIPKFLIIEGFYKQGKYFFCVNSYKFFTVFISDLSNDFWPKKVTDANNQTNWSNPYQIRVQPHVLADKLKLEDLIFVIGL